MPMDKYTKRNNRSELWARRRNNTAQQLLDKRLRHLERDWRIEQKQYKRDENRVKSDLRDLENTDNYTVGLSERAGITDRETVTPNSTDFESFSSEPELKTRPSTGTNTQEEVNVLPETRFRTSALLPSSKSIVHGHELSASNTTRRHQSDSRSSTNTSFVSSIRPTGFHSKLAQPSQSSFAGFFTSTPYRSVASPIRVRGEPQWSIGTGKRRAGCRFTRSENCAKTACEHFPCKTPSTYHSLGFRREDLRSQDENFVFEDRPRSAGSSLPSFLTKPQTTGKQGCKTEASIPCNNTWKEAHGIHDTKAFSRMIHGPPFEPAPVDTIFEKIRHGMDEKSINSSHVHARVGVQDRIRGLQQLVTEMKLRNESVKPPDWAINYGRRVPTRVLLNPVVPI